MSTPDNVQVLEIGGRRIVLVGTAHVSRSSVAEVREVIEREAPDTVCVELDKARHRALTQGEAWREMDIVQVIRQGQGAMLLAHLILSAFQRRIGDKLGVKPGAEMIEAVRLADARNATLVLADRDVRVTLRRTWANLGWWDKARLGTELMAALVVSPAISEEEIEQLKERDMLGQVMESFARAFPRAKATLIDERDVYLAEKLRAAPGGRIVAVVGAGHLAGIMERLRGPAVPAEALAALETVPPKSKVVRVLQWAIPLAVLGLIARGFATSGLEVGLEMVAIWVGVNGGLSALGALLALAHPVTIASAFVAAPITSLNPMIGAGWVAGLVEAALRRPRVIDFERLPDDLASLKGFWRNGITRILLVGLLSSVGSAIGTFAGAFWVGTLSG